MLKRKDSLQLVTTIQSESSDASTLAPSYFFDAFFEEDDVLIDDDLTLSESCSPDSPSHLLNKASNYLNPRFAFPPTLRHRPIDPSHIVTERIACMVVYLNFMQIVYLIARKQILIVNQFMLVTRALPTTAVAQAKLGP
jgi:hypothetical protein